MELEKGLDERGIAAMQKEKLASVRNAPKISVGGSKKGGPSK